MLRVLLAVLANFPDNPRMLSDKVSMYLEYCFGTLYHGTLSLIMLYDSESNTLEIFSMVSLCQINLSRGFPGRPISSFLRMCKRIIEFIHISLYFDCYCHCLFGS